MTVLVACEYSGRVRDAFLRRGIDAVSCDLEPTETPGPHIQGDVLPLLRKRWAMVIAHPPCTHLANSGARWVKPQETIDEAVSFFMACLDANADLVAVENPVMNLKRTGIRKPDFTVQPWHFGDNQRSAPVSGRRTCRRCARHPTWTGQRQARTFTARRPVPTGGSSAAAHSPALPRLSQNNGGHCFDHPA